jgi:4-hydroxythreonine-4-phosphate dehydrogenase
MTLAPLALTMGEPAGIGGELTLKAWHALHAEAHPFFVIDDPRRLQELGARIGLATPIETIGSPEAAQGLFARALPVLDIGVPVACQAGKPRVDTAPAVLDAIRQAVALTVSGMASAVVTNPIQKSVLVESGFNHPGHTEFLAELAGSGHRSVMMLVGGGLRVVPVTVHMPLARVPKALTGGLIIETATLTAEALRRDFGIAQPRLAVAGLNPHAGENGVLGSEEGAIISPALESLRASGIDVAGPLPADTMFHAEARARYDAALCMYHDQALVPLKTLAFDSGVNTTLGLPFVRTSPDHGTALDIAGTGKASASSLISALALAGDMARRRREHG